MSADCSEIYSSSHKCSYAESHCEAFHILYFCYLDESFVIYPLLIVSILFFIYLLGSTADQYFSPALAKISDTLKLSPTVAGVSLLAFGNGAPDVFSSILAAKKLKISLSIGALFGGALFVSGVVFGRVILAADRCSIDQNKTMRDCSLLIVTTLTIVVYGFLGSISIYQACLFPLLYFLYVVIVLKMEKKKVGLMENSLELASRGNNYCEWAEVIDDYVLLKPEKVKKMPQIRYDDLEWSQIKERFSASCAETRFRDLNILERVLWVVDYPFTKMRQYTIPFYTPQSWSRAKASLFPLCASFFILYSQSRTLHIVLYSKLWGWSIPLILTGLSSVLGLAIFFTSKRTVLPHYNDQLSILSFIMSILWIIAVCEYMIDAISLIGLILDLPVSFLGLTLLSWGNSAGDFVANPAITRLGMSQTAVTACFAGPLFNSLIGFGISLIVACSSKDVSFHILDHTQLVIASVFLILSNSVCGWIFYTSGGNIKSFYAYVLFLLYALCFLALMIYTLS